jgi:hypothetical protein
MEIPMEIKLFHRYSIGMSTDGHRAGIGIVHLWKISVYYEFST